MQCADSGGAPERQRFSPDRFERTEVREAQALPPVPNLLPGSMGHGNLTRLGRTSRLNRGRFPIGNLPQILPLIVQQPFSLFWVSENPCLLILPCPSPRH